MYIFRILITKHSGRNSIKRTDLHTKGMYVCTYRTKKKKNSIAGSAAENRSVEEDLSLCLSMPPSGCKKTYAMAFNAVITETNCCIHTTKYSRASPSSLAELFLLPRPPLNAKKTSQCLSYPSVAKIQLLHGAG